MHKEIKPELTIIVPCFNEEDAIEETVRTMMNTVIGDRDYQLLVVNDGSTDKTREVLESLDQEYDKLTVIHQMLNAGYGASLKVGLSRAKADYIAITDADGTYPNERIPELFDLCRNVDMVVGARVGAGVKYSKIRKIPKVFLVAFASWMVGRKIPDMNSGLRIFRKEAAERYRHLLPDGFSFTTTITMALMRNRYQVLFEPITYEHRIGKSKIKPIRDTINFFTLILRIGLYFGPLRFFGPLILLFAAGTVASLGYDMIVEKNLTDKSVILIMFTLNTWMFAMLADMIDKRIM